MAFSFSNWFKKPTSQDGLVAAAHAPEVSAAPALAPRSPTALPPPATKAIPTNARPMKTVLPNSVRPINLREGMPRPGVNPIVPPGPSSLRPGPSARPATRPIVLPGMVPVPPAAPPAPVIQAAPPTFNPTPDAVVKVTLGDFFDYIPTNLLRPGAVVDRTREVFFKSSDLYSDLARGRASVPVSAVQGACPELFSRPVSPTEDVEINLPLQRVIEQLASTFQARPDQVAEEDVAEIETPFLQVALEDSVRLPKPPAPTTPLPKAPPAAVPPTPPARNPLLKTGSIAGAESATIRALTPRQTPSAPHAPAQASANQTSANSHSAAPNRDGAASINPAKRPPATVRASVAGGKIRLSGPAISSRSIAPAAANTAPPALAPSAPPAAVKPVVIPSPQGAPAIPAQKKTARIQIPTIVLRPPGAPTPAPATAPRQASPSGGGRPVPFPEPLVSFRATPGEGPGPATAPAAPRPVSIPTLPPADLPLSAMPAFAPVPPAAPTHPSPFPVAIVVAEEDSAKIALALAPILRTMPDTMFAADQDGYRAAEQVPDGARIEFPLGFIATQLAQGRVAVPRAMFVEAMPAECRHLVPVEGEPNEVLIPLQEVFQNLPTGALNRRRDQVVDEVGPEIPTPFSQKAQEDAQRLAVPPAPEESAAEPEPEPEPVPALLAEPTVSREEAPVPVDVAPVAPVIAEIEPETTPVAMVPVMPEEPPSAEISTSEPAAEAQVEHHAPTEVAGIAAHEAAAPEVSAVHLEELPVAEDAKVSPEPVNPASEPLVAEIKPELFAPTHHDDDVVVIHEEDPLVDVSPAISEQAEPAKPFVEEQPPVPELLTPAPHDFAPVELVSEEPTALPGLPDTDGRPLQASQATTPDEIQDALKAIFMVDEDLDAKKVVRLVSSLPGLKACAVMFGDGLKLAGGLEEGLSSGEGFCAMTPPFFRRARTYAKELGLGETRCLALQTERALLSFFMAGDICLSVQHAGSRPLLPGVREKLFAATTELARMYATPVAR